jgi:N-glycosylase/DNA lyase
MNLLNKIKELKDGNIGELISKRVKEFKELGLKDERELFKEVCFCILTANFNAERGIEIQNKINDGFFTLSEEKLALRLRELGYRFPNVRASYIVEARKHKLELDRDWVVKNIKGLGMKEASHFLRNVGFEDYAIIDFHIVDILVDNKLIERPKNLNAKKYIEIENVLKELGKKVELNMAELDLYLWYLETGKVLK